MTLGAVLYRPQPEGTACPSELYQLNEYQSLIYLLVDLLFGWLVGCLFVLLFSWLNISSF